MTVRLARIHAGLFGLLPWRRRQPGRRAPAAGKARCAHEVSRHRAAAMRALFPKLTAWHAPPGYLDEIAEIDRRLREARTLDELASRLGDIERRRVTGAH